MMHNWRTVLGATVDMRRAANRRMIVAMTYPPDTVAYAKARKLHTDAERIARQYRMRG